MNAFEIVIAWTLAAEGTFSDHAADPGGKTIYGVTERSYPQWYALIMAKKTKEERIALAKEFYRLEFWNKLRADEIQSVYVAGELFDTAVNIGRATAVVLTQRAVNIVAAQEGGGNIDTDGRIGPATIAAINRVCKRYEEHLVIYQNQMQGQRYWELFQRDPQRWGNFMAGWAKRLIMHPQLILKNHPEFRAA